MAYPARATSAAPHLRNVSDSVVPWVGAAACTAIRIARRYPLERLIGTHATVLAGVPMRVCGSRVGVFAGHKTLPPELSAPDGIGAFWPTLRRLKKTRMTSRAPDPESSVQAGER